MTVATPNNAFTATLQDLIEYPSSGILSKVLLKDNNSQYTLFCLAAATEIEEHTSTRNAVITVVEGNGNLNLEGKDITLAPGVFVFMPANAPHALQAKENLAFILTLSEHSAKKPRISQQTIDIVKSTSPVLKQHLWNLLITQNFVKIWLTTSIRWKTIAFLSWYQGLTGEKW